MYKNNYSQLGVVGGDKIRNEEKSCGEKMEMVRKVNSLACQCSRGRGAGRGGQGSYGRGGG